MIVEKYLRVFEELLRGCSESTIIFFYKNNVIATLCTLLTIETFYWTIVVPIEFFNFQGVYYYSSY